jgi:hypothetical protein
VSISRVATRSVDDHQQLQRIAESVNGLIDGKLDVTGTLTLEDGATSTVILDNKFESNMVPVLIPTTANAAGALATTYLSARAKGSFTLTHANNAQTDKTFLYVRFG